MTIRRVDPYVFVLLLVLRAEALASEQSRFASDWDPSSNRTWVGSQYWANPMQDWRVRDGHLECVKAGPNRNVQLLVRQVNPKTTATVSVDLAPPAKGFDGWVGMRFASHGRIDDYRHAVIYGKGIDAGWTSDNHLILGGAKTPISDSPSASSGELLTLRLTLTPTSDRQIARLELIGRNGALHGAVSEEFDSSEVYGNLALVCHSTKKKRASSAGALQPVATFTNWRVEGSSLSGGDDQAWGPILWSQYTLSRSTLKLATQFPPLGSADSDGAELQVLNQDGWESIATAKIDPVARVALFRVEGWNDTRDVAYRISYRYRGRDHHYRGVIRRDPVDRPEIAVAGFTGHKDYGFPNREIVANVGRLDPDLLFFSGDQVYETNGGFGIIRSPTNSAVLDYLHKWCLFGWSFGDLLKDRPSVILPDDHDVYQGNVWGQGGRRARFAEAGGFVMPAEWVNMVQRTQTAHLPDPYDSRPVKQGIGVYYTELLCGRLSFAVLEDRKFKTGPRSARGVVEDSASAVLLGNRQLEFLRAWAKNWSDCDMKATLSATVFAQCHTHGGSETKPLRRDTDANGWPQQGRNRALHEIRKGFAFMYAGDNHLPTVAHHGIDQWEDAGVSFTTPSIAAGFPRAWWPKQPGASSPKRPRNSTGRSKSPWGHPLTMLATANPDVFIGHRATTPGDLQLLQKKSSGFGLVRFNTDTRKITVECWKILADPDRLENAQFEGWPITIDQQDNYGRKAAAWLPAVEVRGLGNPVVQIVEESSNEIVYTLRIKGQEFRPKVFSTGSYTVRVGDGSADWQERNGLHASDASEGTLNFGF